MRTLKHSGYPSRPRTTAVAPMTASAGSLLFLLLALGPIVISALLAALARALSFTFLICVLAASALLVDHGPVRAEADFRLHSTYLSSRLANGVTRTTDQVLECRTLYRLGLDRSITLLGQLQRAEDLEQRAHLFRGRVDAQYRSTPLDLYFRNRPDQRTSVHTPVEWRSAETTWGANWHREGLPNLRFESGDRERNYGVNNIRNTKSDERRLTAAYRALGLDLSYVERWQRSRAPRTIAGIPIPDGSTVARRLHEASYAVDGQRDLSGALNAGIGYRHVRNQDKLPTGAKRRNFRDEVETRMLFRPSSYWNLGGNLSWETLRLRNSGAVDQTDRNLDSNGSLSVEPLRGLNATVLRTYQRRTVAGVASVSDYMRAQMVGRRSVLPDLAATGTLARNWILAQQGEAAPSDQAGLRLDGTLRHGATMAVELTGQILGGVPQAQKYRTAQSVEMRLRPVDALQLLATVTADRQGGEFTVRHADRRFFTVESICSLRRGGSFTLRYDGHRFREQSSGQKYGVSGSVSAPWRWGDVGWSWSAVRASNAEQARGRDFGISSGATFRVRFSRLWELTMAQTRALPATGSGTSLWSASLLQRF
ncbi:MAG: hypothetical protein IPK72_03295 [Candidatus Eisenbacteria bacterium]|nr:hypothetical protein [Candidatus Eisenbacteria bacterium]